MNVYPPVPQDRARTSKEREKNRLSMLFSPYYYIFRSNPRLNALQTILRCALFDIDLVSFQRAL